MVAYRMISKDNFTDHLPVLLNEVIENLAIKPDGIYVDATFGRGGHSRAILSHLNLNGRLFAFDKDQEAVNYALQHFSADERFCIQQGSFIELKNILNKNNLLGKVDGILMDLGVSSPQLDDPKRGFSFLREGELDMRMDTSKNISAAEWLATVSEKELAQVLWEKGEEKFSRRIARAIVEARQKQPIVSTIQLAGIIAAAHPAWQKGKHPATQSFQAIRIFINRELEDLQQGLEQSLDVLAVGGRLLVISFHSLEDRIVKQFIQRQEKGEEVPRGLPIKNVFKSRLKHLGRAIKPSEQEIDLNPRARSAKLRIAEKVS